jgi:hypothetical protein
MTAVFILFALSALIGFLLGKSFSWPAIAAFSIGLAVLSAVILQRQGFDAPSGIALGVAFLSLSQIAYLGGTCVRHRVDEGTDKEPREGHDTVLPAISAGNKRVVRLSRGRSGARDLAPAYGSGLLVHVVIPLPYAVIDGSVHRL